MSTAHVETTPLSRPTRHLTADHDAPRRARDEGDLGVVLAMPTARRDQRELELVAGQRRRLDVQARQLGRLMERRPELRGAYAPADLALEALITGI